MVDISIPGEPHVKAEVALSDKPHEVALAGDVAYVACRSALKALDISDPEVPSFLDQVRLDSYHAYDVAVAGDVAYVAWSTKGLLLVDISDPESLEFIGPGVVTPDIAKSVAIAGDVAYVTCWDALLAVDISDPYCPEVLDDNLVLDYPYDVAVSGNVAYFAYATHGLWMVDISDPENLHQIGEVNTPGNSKGLAVAGDVVYVADGNSGLQVIKTMKYWPIFQAAPWAYSKTFEGGSYEAEPFLAGRIATEQIGQIDWSLTGDGGDSWINIPADNEWHPLNFGLGRSTIDMRWRAELIYNPDEPLVNPTCTNLEIDWLYEFPIIEAVADIPDDQGGFVNLSWTRSGYDLLDSSTPITEYAVYRRSGDPPAGWDSVMTVPVQYDNEYSVNAPTLVDSTIVGGMAYSTFFVRALTASPDVYYDSPPDSGYSVDNLAPAMPVNLHFETGNLLAWDESSDEDFDHFTLYGSAVDYLDESAVMIGTTTGTELDISDHPYGYYHLTATDLSGNEGEEATVNGTTDVRNPRIRPCIMYSNYPNPFNNKTALRFDLPNERHVKLSIYSIDGRRVATLVNKRVPAGHHSITWAGRDNQDHQVRAGVYFYRLEAGDYMATKRMTLIR